MDTGSEAMTNELRRVTDELENLKSAISISEQSKTEEIQSIEERCEQDLLSLRQIMKESLEEVNVTSLQRSEYMDRENADLRSKIIILETTNVKLSKDNEQHCSLTNSPPEKESFLTNISKSFQKKTPTHEQDPDNLEYIMQKAQESNEILKSVVLPLETEIKSLKTELTNTQVKLKLLEDGNSLNSLAGHVTLDNIKSSNCTSVGLNGQPIDQINMVPPTDEVKVEVSELLVNQTHRSEDDWQALRKEASSLNKQLNAVHRKSEKELQVKQSLREQLDSIQGTLESANHLNSNKISELNKSLIENETMTRNIRALLVTTQSEMQLSVRKLTNDRIAVNAEMLRLQNDNDFLVDKHSSTSRQLQDQTIDIPNNVEDLQLIFLKQREDLIKAKVANDYIIRKYKSEQQFIKDQHTVFQQEQKALEESLTQEISDLKKDKKCLDNTTAELISEKRVREDTEAKFRELQCTLDSVKKKSHDTIDTLQTQAQLSTTKKTDLESNIRQLKIRLQTLQVDYDNSEAVQQDFVKLSQSLQVQLEKLRSSEHEVRFQHEDDYDNCNDCHQKFATMRHKHHCRHCGHLFCVECLNQKVSSGPNRRPMSVCRVCHTMLVQDATPYFSQS